MVSYGKLAVFALLGVSLFLLGCTQPGPAATPTAGAVATATPTAAATAAATPTPAPVTEPTVTIVQAPSSGTAGAKASFTWKVDAPAGMKATHTSVHWDVASRPGNLGTGTTPQMAGYDNLISTFASGNFDLPREFTGDILLPSSGVPYTVFFRAHALVDGKHYWTAERSFTVVPGGSGAPVAATPTPAQAQVREFDIVLDHASGFSPATFDVNRGDTVRFRATTQQTTHKHGLKIAEFGVDREVATNDPQNPVVIEFVADKAGTFAITCGTCAQGPFGPHTWWGPAQITVR